MSLVVEWIDCASKAKDGAAAVVTTARAITAARILLMIGLRFFEF